MTEVDLVDPGALLRYLQVGRVVEDDFHLIAAREVDLLKVYESLEWIVGQDQFLVLNFTIIQQCAVLTSNPGCMFIQPMIANTM